MPITYKTIGPNAQRGLHVYLDGRKVGTIKRADGFREKWQYFPSRSKHGGQVFDSIAAVKKSLEGDDD